MSIERVLKNGVIKHSLETTNDFCETQSILDLAEALQGIDAVYAYSDRVENSFCGTYEISISRVNDYKRFIDKLEREQFQHSRDKTNAIKARIQTLYNRGFYHNVDSFNRDYDTIYWNLIDCSCKLCELRPPTIEEWKTGKYQVDEKRIIRLSKYLLKQGCSQSLIDFYSLQSKSEKSICLTISDRVQHIAGMSNYARIGSFDGYKGSSCQDTRHDDDMCVNLAGSLHDDKLFIGMLHDSLDDVNDMQDKLLARVILRYVSIDEIPCLVSTIYYGNNETKDQLQNALSKLSEVNIFDSSIRHGDFKEIETIRESANGIYTTTMTDTINIVETIEEDVSCTCPLCGGSGEYEVYSDLLERHFDVTCPACEDGTLYSSVYIEVDEDIEVERDWSIKPYAECYTHKGSEILIDVNVSRVRAVRELNR